MIYLVYILDKIHQLFNEFKKSNFFYKYDRREYHFITPSKLICIHFPYKKKKSWFVYIYIHQAHQVIFKKKAHQVTILNSWKTHTYRNHVRFPSQCCARVSQNEWMIERKWLKLTTFFTRVERNLSLFVNRGNLPVKSNITNRSHGLLTPMTSLWLRRRTVKH